jgi:DegV family protein with EDD domain
MSSPGAESSGPSRVAVVTDSTSGLPADVIQAWGVRVVPLRILAGGSITDDAATGLTAVIEAAASRGERVTTARPTPDQFAAVYEQLAAAGASAVVSVHLSGLLSGTASSAALAAAGAPLPVRVVDSKCVGLGLGLVVLAAVVAAADGLAAAGVAAAAERYASQTCSFLALEAPDVLLASGRMLTGRQAVPGRLAPARPAGLTSRPLLTIRAGQITMLERVRTSAAAAARLADLAAEFAAERAVDLGVQHTAAVERAAALADRLATAIPGVRTAYLTEASWAIRVHAGSGMLGVVLAPHLASTSSEPGRAAWPG